MLCKRSTLLKSTILKLILLTPFLILIYIIYSKSAKEERNILLNQFKYKRNSIDKSLISINQWRKRLKQQVEQNLNKIPDEIKDLIIEKALNETEVGWPSLLASQYLEFFVNGSRMNFELSQNSRRVKLIDYILCEMLTEQGEFLKKILDGLWLILEESTWTLPAHLFMQKEGFGLPDPNQFVIDLGACEWAALVSWIKLIMGITILIFKTIRILILNFLTISHKSKSNTLMKFRREISPNISNDNKTY